MKHLLAMLSAAVTIGAAAQTMPYNADANSDGFIGSSDLLTFLPLYDTQVGLTDSVQTCNYDGTDFQNWVIGVLDMSILIDSIRISYLIEDSLLTYSVGCPDGEYEYVTLERSYVIHVPCLQGCNPPSWQFYSSFSAQTILYGYQRKFEIQFSDLSNAYNFYIYDQEIEQNPILTFSGGNGFSAVLPFNDVGTIDSTGLHLSWPDYFYSWVPKCTYFSILPYWHYAD